MKKRVTHACRVIRSPWPGVFGTDIDSGHQYDPHWHTAFGFGLIERGAHRSMSGRGIVDAQVGDVIASNPGEVHDGRPLGVVSRRWKMIYLDPPMMASMAGQPETPAVNVRLTERVTVRSTPEFRPGRAVAPDHDGYSRRIAWRARFGATPATCLVSQSWRGP